jgi:hypothetical protein
VGGNKFFPSFSLAKRINPSQRLPLERLDSVLILASRLREPVVETRFDRRSLHGQDHWKKISMELDNYLSRKIHQTRSRSAAPRCPACGMGVAIADAPALDPGTDAQELAFLLEQLENGTGDHCVHARLEGNLWSFPHSACDQISREFLRDKPSGPRPQIELPFIGDIDLTGEL